MTPLGAAPSMDLVKDVKNVKSRYFSKKLLRNSIMDFICETVKEVFVLKPTNWPKYCTPKLLVFVLGQWTNIGFRSWFFVCQLVVKFSSLIQSIVKPHKNIRKRPSTFIVSKETFCVYPKYTAHCCLLLSLKLLVYWFLQTCLELKTGYFDTK